MRAARRGAIFNAMRKGATLALLLCAFAFGQETLVEGITVESSTGRPIPGVHVSVFIINASMTAKAYGAMSDAAGRFSIARIPPGSYFYLGEKPGYLTLGKGGAVPFPGFTLKAGERLTGFKLEMTPRATIAGRVLDEYGDPVQNAQVQITPVVPDAPVAFTTTGGSIATDDRGEFRLPAAPGRYRVQANVFRSGRTAEIRTDGTSSAEYVPTWYPDSPTPDRASAVEVAAGAEVNGIEIRLGRRTVTGSAGPEGVVAGIPDARGWADVHLVSRDPATQSTFQQTTQTGGDGKFSFRNLRPGQYRMFARYTIDNKALMSQVVEFNDAAPPVGVVLRLAPAPNVTGTLAFDAEDVPEAKRTVQLRALEPVAMSPNPSGDTEARHAFRVAGVFPGRYRVTVRGLPENAYVRAVEVDSTAAAPEDVDLTRGASRLKVLIGRNAAQVTGHAVDRDGARLSNTLGAVLLLRDRTKAEFTDEEAVARLAEDGSYSFKGLRPGKYWLLAVDAFRSGNFNSPEQLKKYVTLAEEIELKEGDRLRKDIRIITKEALDAAAK